MCTTTKVGKDEGGKSIDATTYRSMIRSILYLTTSRPDIMFSMCAFTCFQSDPKESHLTVVKRILRYLVGTHSLCLWYPMDCNFDLRGYSDVDYAGCLIDRKSTSSVAMFVGLCIIS
ncbi:hypothetical protein RND81_09G082200 [Saponaria officinalis]|uniref:Mitochondrial protein n=1 Tax=Saponaria officinalis TaxID=3572 RepID=A0AAW1IKC2_SAPOF